MTRTDAGMLEDTGERMIPPAPGEVSRQVVTVVGVRRGRHRAAAERVDDGGVGDGHGVLR